MGHTFQNKVVLITGGSEGIGFASAKAFGNQGARVAIMARRAARVSEAVTELKEMGTEAIGLVGDAANPSDCDRILEELDAAWGRLDILVNNAALHHRGPLLDNDPNDLAKMIQVNLESPIRFTRTALPLLQRQGGAIVNVASLAGCVPVPGSATYSASKFGLRAFSLALRAELKEEGVTVSLVSPGPVRTRFILGELDQVTDITLSQPMVTPEQVAQAVIACARDGRAERMLPAMSGVLAYLGYLFPPLKRAITPVLKWRGAKAKQGLLQERRNQGD